MSSSQQEEKEETVAAPSPLSPPNGGTLAWLQVFAGFLIFFNSWGLVNTFGVFQAYYSSDILQSTSNSTISWIGSIEAFFLCTSSVFAGPLYDVEHGRLLVFAGSTLVVFGMMMTSLCTEYWQFLLAQGVVVGIGSGTMWIVSVAVMPVYFSTRRALSIGIAASGSSVGGVVYPIMFHYIQPGVGFRWATRIIAFSALLTLAIACACIRPPSRSQQAGRVRRRLIDVSGFQELSFNLFCCSSFTAFCGLYIPFFYISNFASKEGFDDTLAFYMLPILSAGSIIGRILPNQLADIYGPLNLLILCTFMSGLLAFCWIADSTSVPGLVVWSILYGLFSGAIVSLQPACIVKITTDLKRIGGRLGTNTFFAALGVLIGTPVAGRIVADSWTGLRIFCGSMLMLSVGFAFLTRCSTAGLGLKIVT